MKDVSLPSCTAASVEDARWRLGSATDLSKAGSIEAAREARTMIAEAEDVLAATEVAERGMPWVTPRPRAPGRWDELPSEHRSATRSTQA